MASTATDRPSIETIKLDFITGIENAHALENEAIELMERQIERIEHYPEMRQILRQHVVETRGQVRRLEEILESFTAQRSVLKDVAAKIMGTMAALVHTPAGDEILKDTFANHAFENYEIAAYKSLIAMAEAGGFLEHVPALQETLHEEQRTAKLIHDHIEAITLKYLARESRGLKADR
jgi:ferritin-like metal-binding protein YciE